MVCFFGVCQCFCICHLKIMIKKNHAFYQGFRPSKCIKHRYLQCFVIIFNENSLPYGVPPSKITSYFPRTGPSGWHQMGIVHLGQDSKARKIKSLNSYCHCFARHLPTSGQSDIPSICGPNACTQLKDIKLCFAHVCTGLQLWSKLSIKGGHYK